MAFINIEIDKKILNELENKIKEAPRQVQKAGVFAVNRTLEMAKTKVLKSTTERYEVKRRDIFKSLRIRKANYNNLNGKIVSEGKVLGLDHFKLSPKKRSKRGQIVRVSVKKGERKNFGKSVFIPYRTGKLGAFSRYTKKSHPIQRIMGPSAPQMIGNSDDLLEIEEFMDKKLNERFIHELNRIL